MVTTSPAETTAISSPEAASQALASVTTRTLSDRLQLIPERVTSPDDAIRALELYAETRDVLHGVSQLESGLRTSKGLIKHFMHDGPAGPSPSEAESMPQTELIAPGDITVNVWNYHTDQPSPVDSATQIAEWRTTASKCQARVIDSVWRDMLDPQPSEASSVIRASAPDVWDQSIQLVRRIKSETDDLSKLLSQIAQRYSLDISGLPPVEAARKLNEFAIQQDHFDTVNSLMFISERVNTNAGQIAEVKAHAFSQIDLPYAVKKLRMKKGTTSVPYQQTP